MGKQLFFGRRIVEDRKFLTKPRMGWHRYYLHCSFYGLKLSGSDMEGTAFFGCTFVHCRFSGPMEGAVFCRSVFKNSQKPDAKLVLCRILGTDGMETVVRE